MGGCGSARNPASAESSSGERCAIDAKGGASVVALACSSDTRWQDAHHCFASFAPCSTSPAAAGAHCTKAAADRKAPHIFLSTCILFLQYRPTTDGRVAHAGITDPRICRFDAVDTSAGETCERVGLCGGPVWRPSNLAVLNNMRRVFDRVSRDHDDGRLAACRDPG